MTSQDAKAPTRQVAPPSPGPPSEHLTHMAYGEASIMLIESLMALLVQRGLVGLPDLIESIETAIATKRQMAADHEHAAISTVAAGILSSLANSLAALEKVMPRE